MSHVTQPRMARGTLLPAGILAAALFALLAFAPFASAAADPVASGTTTITLDSGFSKVIKKAGIKLQQISPATVKGKTVTLPVSGGTIDPLTGQGTLTHSGGIKFKLGKKSVALKSLELNTTTGFLSAKVGSKTLPLAAVKGFTFAREGFGVSLKVAKLKLTGKAVKELNKALTPTAKKKGKRASTSKKTAKAKPIFKANQVFGGATGTAQPSTVTVLPGGNVSLATDAATIGKLKKVGVTLPISAPTTEPSPGLFDFPISGGTVGPTATSGVVQTSGGLQLLQKLQTGATSYLESEITLGAFYVDLAAKTASVEVIAKSNVETEPGKKPLELGNIGRSSIADISLTGATVTADPTNHTVSVQNAAATLQPVAAEVLDGFVKVYEGYEKAGGPPASPEHITTGAALGTISFTAQTE
jgi:hypothetical protein